METFLTPKEIWNLIEVGIRRSQKHKTQEDSKQNNIKLMSKRVITQ
jgi:hypothetical protein